MWVCGSVRRSRRVRLSIVGAFSLAVVLLLGSVSPAVAFPDVTAGHPYARAINSLSTMGIIGGYADGTFGPDKTVTRAQFAKMIVNTLGIEVAASTATRFTDLGTPDANGYPHRFVQAAYENGITTGTNSAQTLFSPGKPIRRDQVISMVVRGTKALRPGYLVDPPEGTPSRFAGIGEPHGPNLRIAEFNGLLDGLAATEASWDVTASATRGEVAQILWNLLPGEATVKADRSGDYPTLDAALADVGPHMTINLGPGTYTLAKTMLVDVPLELVGSGMDGAGATTVVCDGTVVEVRSTFFVAEGVRFVSTATRVDSDVIEVSNGSVMLRGCYLTGGHRVKDRGSGLFLGGTAVAVVSGCTFAENGLHGISVEDDAQLLMENSLSRDNGQGGVLVTDNARATLRSNTFRSNALHGIGVQDRASVVIENNACISNGQGGIVFHHSSSGTVQGNECVGNKWGIYMAKTASPIIGTNDLRSNTYDFVVE